MQRKHMTYWGLGVAAATLAIVALPLTTVQADTTEDPGTAALPVIVDAAADPAKAVVVRLDFASRTETSVRASPCPSSGRTRTSATRRCCA